MWTRRQFVQTAAASAAAAAMPGAAPAQPAPATFIDSHVHVWQHSPAFPFAPGAHPPPEDASPETLLDLMRANHVARTVIIQVIHYKWDNRYLAQVLRRYPKQFHGVCRVDPEDPNAPHELRRLTEEHGFRGVRLSPAAGPEGNWITGPLMPPLWRRCAQLRVPMTLLIPVDRLPQIHPLIEANPDLQIVIDHMADSPATDPAKLAMLLALARFPKVFVKISHMWSVSKEGFPYADAAAQVRSLVDTFGAERLMAGTDWPISLKQLSYAQAVSLFRDHLAFLTPEQHAHILYKTVQRVWSFGVS